MFVLPEPVVINSREEAAKLAYSLEVRAKGWENRLAIDTETTGLSIVHDFPMFWSLSDGESRWFLDAVYLADGMFDNLFNDLEQVWVLANAKYDMHMLANFSSPTLSGKVFDVIGMGNMLDENLQQGLKYQARRELGIDMKEFKHVFNTRGKYDPKVLMDPSNRDVLVRYATLDAYATWHVSEALKPRLVNLPFFKEYSAFDYYCDIEVPYTHCLWRMERRGIQVDTNVVDRIRPEFEEIATEAKKEIWSLAGRPINIDSTKQLAELFFTDLKLKPVKETAKGAPCLDKAALSIYADKGVSVAKSILEYRTYTKYISTYLDGHLKKHLTDQNRVHSSLKQFGTITGRLSSREPNMQNIPSKGPGLVLREAFVASQGNDLGVWDYSTLEMRVMAHMSSDGEMIKAIHNGLDIHCFTAAQMMGVDYSEAVAAKLADDMGLDSNELPNALSKKAGISVKVARDTIRNLDEAQAHALVKARTAAKAVGFGVMYGLGPTKLADSLSISTSEAKGRINEWFDTFPKVRRFINDTHANIVRPPHEVRTISGRYRRLNEGGSSNGGLRAAAQRRAVNTPIQGSAGDIVKFAMLKIDQDPLLGGCALEGGTFGVKMVMQVHDELICECDKDFSEASEQLIKAHMSNPGFDMRVPLDVEGGYGINWKEAK